MAFNCECCNYKTPYVANYNKHLKTERHHKNLNLNINLNSNSHTENENENENDNENEKITCKYCEQQFKFKQSMYRHIKYSCTKNKDEDLKELVRLLNCQLEQQKKDNEQTKKEMQSMSKQIDKLMGKLEIKGSFNTNTNTNTINNIQNITLNAYKDTDVSHLTDNDYRACIKKVCHSVLKLIEKVHFNPNKPENMNIYISNMKDKYLMVYDGAWILKNKTTEIEKLYADKELMLEEWLCDNNEPELQQFFDRYMNNKKDSAMLDDINEQLKLMMYNKPHSQLVRD